MDLQLSEFRSQGANTDESASPNSTPTNSQPSIPLPSSSSLTSTTEYISIGSPSRLSGSSGPSNLSPTISPPPAEIAPENVQNANRALDGMGRIFSWTNWIRCKGACNRTMCTGCIIFFVIMCTLMGSHVYHYYIRKIEFVETIDNFISTTFNWVTKKISGWL